MTIGNYERDLERRLSSIEDQQKRMQARLTTGMPFQILGNGQAFFSDGVQVGGGSMVEIYQPPDLPPPTGLSGSSVANGNAVYIDLHWNLAAGYGADQVIAYLVQITKDGTTVPIETTVSSGISNTRIGPLEPNTLYHIQVASVSRIGESSTATTVDITSTRDSVPPAAPTGVTVTPGVTALFLKWNANTESDVANGAGTYEVVVSTHSDLSSPTFDQLINGTVLSVPGVAGTSYYVGIKAVDSSGNYSPFGKPTGGPWVPLALTSTDLGLSIGGGNTVKNSGFEDGLSSWTVTSGITVDATNSHGGFGTHSATIATGAGDYFVYQDLTIAQGTWVISAWLKGTSIAGSGLGLVLNWSTQSGTIASPHVVLGTDDGTGRAVLGKGTFDWTRLALQVTVTSSTAVIRIQPQRGYTAPCTGQAWIDEIQAEMGTTITAYAPRADELLTGTVTSTIIADNAIITSKIAANSIVAGKIAAGTIGAAQIQANSITAAQIATDTITANQIAAGAITTSELAANSVTATNITANAITTAKIAANAVTATQLAVTTNISVGQSIQSSNYFPGIAGWHIDGSGNAEFSNATIRGSAIIGGTIQIANKLFLDNTANDIHIFGNVEIGSNYSATLYSGLPVTGGGHFGIQIGNDGTSGGLVWSHLEAPISGNPNFYLALYDNYGSGKRVWYANSSRDTWNPGPEGRIVSEKRSQDGDFATKGILIQNGPTGSGGNGDHAGISFHSPDHGIATSIQLDASVDNSLGIRNSTNTGFAALRASSFIVSSAKETKQDIQPLQSSIVEKLLLLNPVSFKRFSDTCSYCADTGIVTHGGLQHPKISPANRDGEPPLLEIGSVCPLCNGEIGQGNIRRQAGHKKTEDSGYLGLIAEEVAEHFPEAVSWKGSGEEDLEPDGIDYSALVSVAILELQHLHKEIAELKAKVK